MRWSWQISTRAPKELGQGWAGLPTGSSKCFLKSRDWIKVCFRSENNTTSFPGPFSVWWWKLCLACFHSQAADWGWRRVPGEVFPGAVQPGPGFPPLAAPDAHGHPGFAFSFHSSSINGPRSGKLALIPSGSSSDPHVSCANPAHEVGCLPDIWRMSA